MQAEKCALSSALTRQKDFFVNVHDVMGVITPDTRLEDSRRGKPEVFRWAWC